jgi:pSer/pThr/pTyr-binding forkhead associated (FHA) protein
MLIHPRVAVTLSERMWTLRATDPADLQLSFRLLPGDVKTIGRAAGAQFVVDAPLVSRVHCRLTLSASNDLHVEDLGSTNGTFVNERKVRGKTALQPEDTLRVGRVAFMVDRA